MKAHNKLTIMIVLLGNMLSAQNSFQKAYGGTAAENGNFVVQTTDTGYIIAGTTTSFAEGGRDVYVVKTDAKGDTLWTRTFGGASDNEYGFCVQQTADGGYIVSGVASSFADVAGDMYLIRLTATGDLAWSKTYGGIGYEWGYFVQQTTDGGFVVTGQTPAFGAGGFDAYLVKLDVSGNIVWTKTYGGSGLEIGAAVQQTADGGYVITGAIDSYGAGSGDILLLKTDAAGNAQWAKAIGTQDQEEASSVMQTPDGGYVIAGSGYGDQSLSRDMFLIKTNASGTIDWSKTFGSAVNDECRSAALCADGGFVLCGYSFGFNVDGNYEVYVVKTDAGGNLQWSKTYGGTSFGGDYGYSIQQTADNGYVIAGETYSFGSGFKNVYLIKTDSAGNSGCNDGNPATNAANKVFQLVNAPVITSSGGVADIPATVVHSGGVQTNLCATTTAIEETFVDRAFIAYPNPFVAGIILSLPCSYENLVIRMYNVFGQEIRNFAMGATQQGSESIALDLKELKSGIYLCSIISGNQVQTVKLIKQ